MLCAKREYNHDVIINKYLRFYDLKSNRRYTFFMNSSIKLLFYLSECKIKAIFTFTKSVHAMQFFMLMCNDVGWNKSKHSTELFCFINQSHSFKLYTDRQSDIAALIILKLSYFWKNNSWKIVLLRPFGSRDQEIDSWFMIYKL